MEAVGCVTWPRIRHRLTQMYTDRKRNETVEQVLSICVDRCKSVADFGVERNLRLQSAPCALTEEISCASRPLPPASVCSNHHLPLQTPMASMSFSNGRRFPT